MKEDKHTPLLDDDVDEESGRTAAAGSPPGAATALPLPSSFPSFAPPHFSPSSSAAAASSFRARLLQRRHPPSSSSSSPTRGRKGRSRLVERHPTRPGQAKGNRWNVTRVGKGERLQDSLESLLYVRAEQAV